MIFISILIGKVLKWAERSFADYGGMTADGIERRPDIETAFNALLAKIKECTYYILLLDKQTIHYRTATRIVTILLDLLYPLNFDILRLYIFDNN